MERPASLCAEHMGRGTVQEQLGLRAEPEVAGPEADGPEADGLAAGVSALQRISGSYGRGDPLRVYDSLSWVLIGFITIVSVLRWGALYPHFVDVYYHMGVIRGFSQAGGVVLWDFWEYAPVGRPHVYAPLLHCIGLLPNSLGLSVYAIASVMSWFFYPLSFVLAWRWVRTVAGRRAAFFVVALLAGPTAWFFNQAGHTANALALLLVLGALLAYAKERYITCALVSALACYAHGAGFVAPAAVLLMGIHESIFLRGKGFRKRFAPLGRAMAIVLAVLVLFLPWALHLYANRALIKETHAGEGFWQFGDLPMNLLLGPLAAVGLILAYAKRGKALAFPSFLLAFIVLFPMSYGHRFWRFNAFLPYAALGAFGLEAILGYLEKPLKLRAALGFSLVVCLAGILLVPEVSLLKKEPPAAPPGERAADRAPGRQGMPPGAGMPPEAGMPPRNGRPSKGRVRMELAALPALLLPDGARQRNLLREPRVLEMIELVSETTGKDDVIFVGDGPAASLLTAMTGRRTTGGMLAEVRPAAARPGSRDAAVIVVPKQAGETGAPPFGGPPRAWAPPGSLPDTAGMELVVEGEYSKLFRNPDPVPAPSVPAPVMGALVIGLLGLCIAGVILLDSVRHTMGVPSLVAFLVGLGVVWAACSVRLYEGVFRELRNPPVPEEGADGEIGPPGPGRRGPPPPWTPDTRPPAELEDKYFRVMDLVRAYFVRGRSPDYFLPPDASREIREAFTQGDLERAERLLDEALERYKAGRP